MVILALIGIGIIFYLAWLIGSCAGFTQMLWTMGGTTGKVVVCVLTALVIAFVFWLVLPDPVSPPVVQ